MGDLDMHIVEVHTIGPCIYSKYLKHIFFSTNT